MKRKEVQQEWQGLRDELLEEVARWRKEHRRATINESEEEIDVCLSRLRAQMITDTANTSERAKWEAADAVECPECGAKTVKTGQKKRILRL